MTAAISTAVDPSTDPSTQRLLNLLSGPLADLVQQELSAHQDRFHSTEPGHLAANTKGALQGVQPAPLEPGEVVPTGQDFLDRLVPQMRHLTQNDEAVYPVVGASLTVEDQVGDSLLEVWLEAPIWEGVSVLLRSLDPYQQKAVARLLERIGQAIAPHETDMAAFVPALVAELGR